MLLGMENLTEEQALETIAAARMSDEHRSALAAQWRAGDPSARFVVFNMRHRGQMR